MAGNGVSALDDDLSTLALENAAPPPPPPPASGFHDITKEFHEASQKLKVGELVKDPDFTLLQAVSGLEIMDPKMDSGLMEAEYESFDPWKPRLPEEILGIMDRLLSNEISWHSGSALSQTLFTNLYIDRLLSSKPRKFCDATFGDDSDFLSNSPIEQSIIQQVLRPYCLALAKCCCFVIRQILSESTIEEEDFVTQTYDVTLLEHATPEEAIGVLDGAVEYLEKARTSKLASGDVIDALVHRIELRKSLVRNFSRPTSAKEWEVTIEKGRLVEESHHLAKEVAEAWSPSVQRKLASQVPPRPIVVKDFAQTMKDLRQICEEGQRILSIIPPKDASSHLVFLQHFMSRTPTPLPYTRSILQTFLFGEGDITTLLYSDLKDLICPIPALLDPRNDTVEAPQNPGYKIAQHKAWFTQRAGRSYFDLYRNLCQNRPRLRRNLCHSILDWDSMQLEAEECDSELRTYLNEKPITKNDTSMFSYPLSSWVYYWKLRQMEWVHLLGFELEIYRPHEYAGMYWYVQYYLQLRIGHIQRILDFAMQRAKEQKGQKRGGEDAMTTMSLLNAQLLEASAMQELCGGMVNLYTVLGRLDALDKPEQPYSSDSLRYQLRMKPFLTIGLPEVFEFEKFQGAVDSVGCSNSELLSFAAESITEAKKLYSRLHKIEKATVRATLAPKDYDQNIMAYLRSCIGTGVETLKLQQVENGGIEGKKMTVTMEREKFHPGFPVPKVVLS